MERYDDQLHAGHARGYPIRYAFPEQGWSMLCNGDIVFDDSGELLPDGRSVAPRHGDSRPHPVGQPPGPAMFATVLALTTALSRRR